MKERPTWLCKSRCIGSQLAPSRWSPHHLGDADARRCGDRSGYGPDATDMQIRFAATCDGIHANTLVYLTSMNI
eukprot:5841789-Pleurochrysis_carterae.AAC.3